MRIIRRRFCTVFANVLMLINVLLFCLWIYIYSFKDNFLLCSPITEVVRANSPDSLYKPFSIKMTQDEVQLTKMILEQFDAEMTKANLTYFLDSGSLLGAYRHNDIIPWDDDVDVVVPFSQRKKMNATLSALKPSFYFDTTYGFNWKFYSYLSKRSRPKIPWKWPFIDINFYRENETHIWDSEKRRMYYLYNKSIVFPLRKEKFMNLSLPVPRDSYAVLMMTYMVNRCKSTYYDHKREVPIPHKYYKTVLCKELHKNFTFVKRPELT